MSGDERRRALADAFGRYKYALLVAAVGLVLLLWPSGSGSAGTERTAYASRTGETEQERLAALLSHMEGVGRSEVLLSDKGAAVVCQGADSASVRLDVTNAVRCYTGLGADEIVIFKSSESWRDDP